MNKITKQPETSRSDMPPRTLIIFLLLTLIPIGAGADIPLLINYQGSLEGTEGPSQVVFAIYEAEVSEAPIWEESREIVPQNGRFSVLLGSITPLTPGLFEGSTRYLAVSVDGKVLSPRQQIVSVPFAFQSSHATDVADERVTPRSIVLSNGAASLDSLGVLSASSVKTESLSVGGKTVIDQTGAWVGPAISGANGLQVRAIAQTTVTEEEVFFLNSKWVHFTQINPTVVMESAGKLDISFVGQMSSPNGFETRITLRKMPENKVLGSFGNIAGAQPSPASQGATVHNQAIIDLEAGTYRIFIEHQSNAVSEAKLHSGTVITRTYN
jgi:hypothetical protein